MCVLSIKVPIPKKSGNLSYAPRNCAIRVRTHLFRVLHFSFYATETHRYSSSIDNINKEKIEKIDVRSVICSYHKIIFDSVKVLSWWPQINNLQQGIFMSNSEQHKVNCIPGYKNKISRSLLFVGRLLLSFYFSIDS